ncbi:MAG: class I adenylate-forming enzyme family protein [Planctomycetaceae bacterium]
MTPFVEQFPWDRTESPAVTDADGTLTYGALRETAGRAARRISDRYGSGRMLLLKAEPTREFVAAFLGAMWSGNTPVPIDAQSSRESLDYLESKTRAAAVLSPADVVTQDAATPLFAASADVPAIVMTTSGTSGFPKGVVLSHSNVLHACRAMAEYLDYHRHCSAAVVLPLHYSYALLSQVCCQLSTGGHVRLFAAGEVRNPVKLAAAITRAGLETFCGVPSTYFALRGVHRLSPLAFPTVRVVCSAGAAIDPVLYGDIRAMFPNGRLFNNYGMTEAAPRIAYIRDDDPRFGEATCGRPMPGVEVRVVDPQSHRPLPDGERGVLVVRGANITSGYLNDEDATRKAFTSDGWLISGDGAALDKGYIFLSGRLDEMLNVAGEKVAPLEIERALNRLPEVSCAAVTGISDESRGTVPVAFLELTGPISRREVVAALKESLTPTKIPQRYFEVRAFPTTPNGKLVRRRLSIDDPERIVREIL